ncbi:hypothetical protein Trisim1_007404 [Trichoderma cf. simile WF8]
MPSTRKKKDTHEPVIMLSYKDLVRRNPDKPWEQVKKGDPEWEDGIKCIKAYHSQATVLSRADQVGMRFMMKRLQYVIPPGAKNDPLCHPLMRAEHHSMTLNISPSWPIFIILKTLYGTALPEAYLATIRTAFHTTDLNDHTHEYFTIDGAEPAEPAVTEEDLPTSVGDKAEISKKTKKRNASAIDIEDGSSSANKHTKVTGAESLSLPVAETNNEDRLGTMAVQVQLANAVSERQTAEGVGCGCTIGNLWQMIDKKLEGMQDALDKKIEEKFAAAREDLERKEKEKIEAQTNELQTMMREAVKFHGEALTRLAELAWQRPAAPQGADV